MSANRILQLSALAGKTILENGGEIYRVEETVNRVCVSFGLQNIHAYATPGAIIVSAADPGGEVHSVMERIHSRGVNLDKIDAINTFSRVLEREHPDLDTAFSLLGEVRNRKIRSNRVVMLISAFSCIFFTLLFQGSVYDMLPAFVAGLLVKFSGIQFARIRLNDFFVNLIGGAISNLTAWLFVFIGVGQNIDVIATSAIMLLVPGLIITNAVRDITAGDLISGISRLMEAFFVAIAIACGTALAHTLIPFFGGGRL